MELFRDEVRTLLMKLVHFSSNIHVLIVLRWSGNAWRYWSIKLRLSLYTDRIRLVMLVCCKVGFYGVNNDLACYSSTVVRAYTVWEKC